MACEYLPVLEIRDEKLLVKGKIDRIRAHCAPPVPHATSVIAAVLPDGRLLLADKTQKQKKRGRLVPDKQCLIPIGRYSVENGHNREYSWRFLYRLPDFGPYTSEDTLLIDASLETICQPVIAVTWEELCESYRNNGSGGIIISDGIGRMLDQNGGAELYECIKMNQGGL